MYFQITKLRLVTYYFKFYIIKNWNLGKRFLIQEIYIRKILKRFEMQKVKIVDTSIIKNDILTLANLSY